MDEATGTALDRLYPLDRARNAQAVRRPIKTTTPPVAATGSPAGIAPLLRQLMAEYAATGLPPAYIPKEDA